MTQEFFSLKNSCIAVLAIIFVGFLVFNQTPAQASTQAARVVKYSQDDIVTVHAKLRYSTLIVLPENEEILRTESVRRGRGLDFTTGDKDFWIINGAHNLCYIHPAQAGIRSNLNLITASGHVYSFLLTEISRDPNVEPDPLVCKDPGLASTSCPGGCTPRGGGCLVLDFRGPGFPFPDAALRYPLQK